MIYRGPEVEQDIRHLDPAVSAVCFESQIELWGACYITYIPICIL